MTVTDIYEYHEKQKFPSHKGAIAGLLIVFGGFIAFGVYAVWNLWIMYDITGIITSFLPFLAGNMWLIGAGLLGIFGMSLAMGLLASLAARRFGGTLITIGAFVMNILTWGLIIFLVLTGTFPISQIGIWWPVMIPGLFTLFLTLLLFTVFRDRVRRAGEIIKLTGQVTLDEKGTFVPPLLTMIFTLVSAVLFAAILVYFMPQVLAPGYEFVLETDWPYAIGIVVYLFVVIFFYNFAYSTTSAITYIYMRGRDPTLGDGVRSSLGVLGALVVLSIMSVIIAIVRMIIRGAAQRSQSAIGRGVGYAAEGIIGWVWALVNYFTIPAMVAEELSATKAIKRSAGLVRKNFVDVLIKETAVRWGFGVLAFMIFFGFAAFGALFGWIYSAGDIFTTIIVTIVFVVFASIPSTLVLRTFDIVYVTLLYVFIRRKEGDITGKTAIPASLNQELDRAYSRAQQSGE
ncbi:MAG: DUF6159 family protein [Candidatus Thorarchaeota archaeon SMTZ1-45]|nr:MAG: hypothetical protein AM325_10455 [Candidatus Thorarchaeota archaeon SMTZ1-45]